MDYLVQILSHDSCFSQAVQQQDVLAAATAAVGVLKSHWRASSAAGRAPTGAGGVSTAGTSDGGSPTETKRLATEAGRRLSDLGMTPRVEICIKDRVVITTNQKKYEGNLVGREGVVLHITDNGWVKLQVGGEVLDVPMRHLTPLTSRGAGSTMPPASANLFTGAGLGCKGAAVSGSKGARVGIPRKAEVVKQVRKELAQLEEQVPWKEVQDRWRTHRKSWTRRLRQADIPRDIAICIRDFHEHLRTDKTVGLFAAGGAWEVSLRECITGTGNHLQLLQVWEEMRATIQAWLAAGQLPGGVVSLDKATYEQAVHTYQVLQEAASKGPEFLEQVPLDQILTSQKDLVALQHILQREAAAAYNRLQYIAHGAAGAPAPSAAAMQGSLAMSEYRGDLPEDLLLQLGDLPRIKTHEGAGSDCDTDKDMGSEATDLEEELEIH